LASAKERRIPIDKEHVMALIVTATQKQFERADEGEHLAVLADVIDLGEVDTKYGRNHMVRFVWLVEQRDKEGKQISVTRSYTRSLHEKASLRKVIKAIHGRDPGNSFDLETLLGTNMRLVIEHREYEDRVIAFIAVMLKPRKGDTTLTVPSDFVRAINRKSVGNKTAVDRNVHKDSQRIPSVKGRTNGGTAKTDSPNIHGVDGADMQFPGDDT
jgi:hypothetical protein